jgi:hypothetical protein
LNIDELTPGVYVAKLRDAEHFVIFDGKQFATYNSVLWRVEDTGVFFNPSYEFFPVKSLMVEIEA